jgi:hypothetical protein
MPGTRLTGYRGWNERGAAPPPARAAPKLVTHRARRRAAGATILSLNFHSARRKIRWRSPTTIRLSRGRDTADAALVAGARRRSLPTLRQLPWSCAPSAVNGSLLYLVAISAPLVLGGKGRRIGAPPRITLISGRGSTRSGAVLVGIAESWGGALGATQRCQLSLLGSKSSRGEKHHGIVTKTQYSDGQRGGAVLVKNEVENAEVEGAETEAARRRGLPPSLKNENDKRRPGRRLSFAA